jgi:hypothetical protein
MEKRYAVRLCVTPLTSRPVDYPSVWLVKFPRTGYNDAADQ